MKEVVLFGAYTNTPEKEITLIENILKWKKYNIPIALSTHHSVNERIQNLVDYYIFDKEQHLESKLMNYHIYESDEFKITAAFDKPYHAAAGLIALQNALRMIGDKFDFVYLQDYDVQLNVSEVLKIVRPLQTSEFEMFMFNWHNNPKLYTTNCWFFKQGSYNKLWGDIQSVQDYLDLVALTEEHDHLIEPLAKNLINKKQLQEVLYLFNQDQIKKMILNFSQHDVEYGKPKIYLSETIDNRVVLFLVNESSNMMHFEIQKTNLLTNEHETQFQDLDGPGNGIIKMYWRVFDKNSHIKVTCNNIIKEYFISPFTSFNECSFEFYNGTQLYKK